MIEIKELSLGSVHEAEIEGFLDVLAKKLVWRRKQIARLLAAFPGEKSMFFPEILWKEIVALQDTLRTALQTEGQPYGDEASLAFLDFVLKNFEELRPEPRPEELTEAGIALVFAINSLANGELDEFSDFIWFSVDHLERLKAQLRPPEVQARIAVLTAKL